MRYESINYCHNYDTCYSGSEEIHNMRFILFQMRQINLRLEELCKLGRK